jgi:hypothetical protein
VKEGEHAPAKENVGSVDDDRLIPVLAYGEPKRLANRHRKVKNIYSLLLDCGAPTVEGRFHGSETHLLLDIDAKL